MRFRLLAGLSIFAILPTVAQAQDRAQTSTDSSYHRADPDDIIVSALIPRNRVDILSGTSVISGDQLNRELRSTIGETLARQPGVSATSFGPNASRPILRGFQGERVRILTDGIGSFDVSNTSVDHAVAINPLTADRIEVLRGPAALLYGSSAIGGLVNVIDSRIPRQAPDEPIHIESIATYGSAANERIVSGEIEAPITENFVIHLDGTWNKAGNLRTGGYILSAPLRAIAAASDDEELQADARLRGKLPNTAAETWELAGGFAFINDWGNLGFSLSRSGNRYGVPSRIDVTEAHDHDHDHDHEEGEDHNHDDDGDAGHSHEDVTLKMRQTRADMRGEVNVGGGFLDSIRLRAGWASYKHQEIEPTGEVGTTFRNQSIEGRLEFVQARQGGWDGAFGAQLFTRRFEADGEEKFLPRNETNQIGFFILQSLDLGNTRLEAGGRFERSSLSSIDDPDLFIPAYDRSFNALSGSLGISHQIAPGWRVGLNLSRSERAPSAEELFARGNHAGTQAFELGNPNFRKERSHGAELTLRGGGQGFSLSASGFYNDFSNYIYTVQTDDAPCLAANGGADLEFPCFVNFQGAARHYGFEVEGSATLARIGDFDLRANAQADYVRVSIKNAGPAPRIPPLRLMGGLELASDRLSGRIEAEHSFAQKRVTLFETPTDDYTLVNASISWKPFTGNDRTSLILSANNIFDVVARRHASVLKDYAPLAGRDLRITARFDL